MSTKCPSCGNAVNNDQKFCTSCGSKLITEQKTSTTKAGTLKKCPSCGAFVPSFQTKCTECGIEFRETGVSSSIQEFFDSLTALTTNNFFCGESDSEKENNANRSILRVFLYIISANILLFTFVDTGKDSISDALPPIGKLLLVVLAIIFVVISLYIPIHISERNKRKMNLIETFPIPNTKEDIFEFLVLSTSQIHDTNIFSLLSNQGKEYAMWNNVWKTKIKHTYTKAKITLCDDPESISRIKTLLKESKVI